MNYAPLNSITADSIFPINDCLAVLVELCKAEVFSGMDIKAGFNNIIIHPDDTKYTVFIT